MDTGHENRALDAGENPHYINSAFYVAVQTCLSEVTLYAINVEAALFNA